MYFPYACTCSITLYEVSISNIATLVHGGDKGVQHQEATAGRSTLESTQETWSESGDNYQSPQSENHKPPITPWGMIYTTCKNDDLRDCWWLFYPHQTCSSCFHYFLHLAASCGLRMDRDLWATWRPVRSFMVTSCHARFPQMLIYW